MSWAFTWLALNSSSYSLTFDGRSAFQCKVSVTKFERFSPGNTIAAFPSTQLLPWHHSVSFHFLILHTGGNHPSDNTASFHYTVTDSFLASDTHYFHLCLRALSGRPCFIFFFTYSPSVPGYHFYFTHSILLFHYSSVLEDVDDSSVLLLIDRVLNYSQMHCLPSNPCSSYLETKQVSFI